MQEMNLKGAETSFSDYGAKEVLTDISSTNIQTLAMQRLSTDYTLCDIIVLYKGRINLAKGTNTVDLVSGGFYVYEGGSQVANFNEYKSTGTHKYDIGLLGGVGAPLSCNFYAYIYNANDSNTFTFFSLICF